MKFFKARVAFENVGTREIVPLWEYDIDAKNSQAQLADSSLPDTEPIFSKLLITGPLTDVIEDGNAIGGIGFLVSNKLKGLLCSYNLPNHRFYPLESYDYTTGNTIENQYFWLQIIALNYFDLINYAKSEFVLYDDFEEKVLSNLEIKSPGGLMAAVESVSESDSSILYNKLEFNAAFNSNPLDILYMEGISDNVLSYPLFSERLKDELLRQAISGFDFKQAPINL